MQTVNEALEKLKTSKFRASFHLTKKDREYLAEHSSETIAAHARDFVKSRLAKYNAEKDGKQTPMHGHPVFKAMHATACCCRGCLEKWYRVSRERDLTENEQERIVKLLLAWLKRQKNIR